MDRDHHAKWYDMTRDEQFEWIARWEALDGTHEHRENESIGLRGTDLGRIANVEMLMAAMGHSLSLVNRRPEGHDLTVQQFQGAACQLDFL